MIQRMRDRRARDRGDGGFTLIELLVVILILAILAGVVVFAVGGIDDKGQGASCRIDTRTIRTAEEARFGKTGAYTTSETTLVGEGFLSETSGLHDIIMPGRDPDGTAGTATVPPFDVVVADTDCGLVGTTAGTCGATPAAGDPLVFPDANGNCAGGATKNL